MTWTRFDQVASVHAKCVMAGNDAASFWQWAVQWCNRNKTDGYIDGRLLHTVQPVPIAKEIAKALADTCVGAVIKPGGKGLMELADGGYIIHDFHQFQPPADEEEREDWLHDVRSKAGKAGAAKRWQKANGKTDDKTDPSRARAHASDRDGMDRFGKDPEGSAEGGGESSLATEVARAYADGIAEGAGEPWRMPDANVETAIVLDQVGLRAPQLRGEKLTDWVKRSAATYRRSMAHAAEFQRGFRPSKWAEWLSAGRPTSETKIIGAPRVSESQIDRLNREEAERRRAQEGS